MVIPINIEGRNYIKAYLLTLNPVLKLQPQELNILNAMITVYLNLKKTTTMTETEIDRKINEPMGRKIIADLVKTSRHSFNNFYIKLKKKGCITPDNKLANFLKINPNNPEKVITYKINFTKAKPVERVEHPQMQSVQTEMQSVIETKAETIV